MPIAEARIAGVRGVRRELTLPLEGRSLVVRGDNGTGKSSIVAGLLWALRGEQAPSDDAKPGTQESYFANILDGHTASKVTIRLQGRGTLTVTPGAVTADEEGQALRAACERSSPFLLRRHLLQFLEDRPVDRFKYLEAFLDLARADQIRESIAARAKSHQTLADKEDLAVNQHLQDVLALLPPDLKPAHVRWPSTVSALHAWAVNLGLHPAPGWEGLTDLAERLAPILQGDTLARRRIALQDATDAWRKVLDAPPPGNPEPSLDQQERLIASTSDGGLSLLLDEARQHLQQHPDRRDCPVCQQAIDHTELRESLARRVEALQSLAQVRRDITGLAEAWEAYWNLVTTAYQRWTTLTETEAVPSPPDALPSLPEPDRAAWLQAVAHYGAPELQDWVARTSQHAIADLEAHIARLPAEGNTADSRRLVDSILAAKAGRRATEDAERRAHAARILSDRLHAIAESLRAARQDVARELLAEIQTLVAEFYEFIHPVEADDEITGAPAIEVQRRSSGSAHVRGRFNAEDVRDPRWVYSDGHLDTVGICIFLALRRFRADRDRTSDPKLIVLDDVVLSVDLSHGRRLLDLIRERFHDHQILIFTHNGLFYDWCANRLPKFKRKAISHWTVETGPQLGDYPSAIEHLRDGIQSATSPKLLAQSTMNLIDEWLAQARFEYRLSVPAKRGEEYTLTEIWEPFRSRMKKMQQALRVPIGDLDQILGALSDLPDMRNRLAAHENEFAREYPLATVRDFATRTLDLVGTLYCTTCQEFATPTPSHQAPEIVRCKCEDIRFIRPTKRSPSSPP